MAEARYKKPKYVLDSFFGAKLFYFSLTFGIFTIFIIFDQNLLMMDLNNLDFFFPFTFLLFLLLSIYFFLTTGDNPGYMNNFPTSLLEKSQICLINQNNENNTNNEEKKEEEKNETEKEKKTENEQENPYKYCEICKIEKYLRMKHCNKCEICVHKYDHHCFWIGSCVGELNHGKFWNFLFFQTLLNLIAFFICFDALDYYDYYKMVTENDKIEKVYSIEYGCYFVCAIITFFFIIFTGILLGYHTYLIATNQTSWEHNRRHKITYLKDYPRNVYPFSQGILQNIKMIFFTKNQTRIWTPKSLEEARTMQNSGFNFCENEYYSCC